MSSGLVNSLLGALGGGARYIARDAERRQALEEREDERRQIAGEKAIEREALFADYEKKLNVQMRAESAQRAEQQRTEQEMKLNALNDPRALEAEARAAQRRKSEIAAADALGFARLSDERKRYAENKAHTKEAGDLLALLGDLRDRTGDGTDTPPEVAKEINRVEGRLRALGFDTGKLAGDRLRNGRYRTESFAVPNPDPERAYLEPMVKVTRRLDSATGEYLDDELGRPFATAPAKSRPPAAAQGGGLPPPEVQRRYFELSARKVPKAEISALLRKEFPQYTFK